MSKLRKKAKRRTHINKGVNIDDRKGRGSRAPAHQCYQWNKSSWRRKKQTLFTIYIKNRLNVEFHQFTPIITCVRHLPSNLGYHDYIFSWFFQLFMPLEEAFAKWSVYFACCCSRHFWCSVAARNPKTNRGQNGLKKTSETFLMPTWRGCWTSGRCVT